MSLYFLFIYLFFKAVTFKQPHSRLAQKLRANIKYPPHNVYLITKPIETPHSRLQAGNPSSLSSLPNANFLFLRLIGNKRNIIVLRSLPTTQSSNNKETKRYIVFTRLIKKALDPRNLLLSLYFIKLHLTHYSVPHWLHLNASLHCHKLLQ